MDYKNTLNLPRTDFPMKADLVTREPSRQKKWETSGLYAKIQSRRANAAKFVLHDGPPFANGDVHIGTALNKILKDVIVKFKSLRGFQAPYIPGWDCHGLPIEFKVTQEMRKAGDTNSDAATIRRACDAYARKFIDIQRMQFKRLGVLGDWDNPYLTLNKEYEAEELRLLADIVDQGFMYRGKKPVYWSIPCRTALAEAEVEYHDHVSQSIFVKFPIVGRPGMSIVIWTTTPWTLPANLAVAYNSTFSYSLIRHENEELIVSTMLLPAIAAKCGWQGYEIVSSVDTEHLKKIEYQHPFIARTGKLFAGDSFVDNTTGTGFVHIAPGHGLEDYGLGRDHGLPIYSPVDDDGRFAYTNDLPVEQQMPAELIGRSILEKHGQSEANEGVLHQLRLKKTLVHQENYHHSYPHCWRSKTPVIFRAMDQWFLELDHDNFRQKALSEIDQVNWIPAWGINRIKGAVQVRPDWCISRQRTWGVPIPAFYDVQGQPILDARIIRSAASLIEREGSNVWFEKPVEELWQALKPADWSGPTPSAKSTDTLDVWIDSGSSSRAVTARRKEISGKEKPFQADLYLEGSDQHRGWFQSSLLLSLAGNGAAPFKAVLTHGFVVNDAGEKESKSRGAKSSTVWVNDFGADVLRLWVGSQDYRGDLVLSEGRVVKVSETYRSIRNTLRYQLSNLYDFDPTQHAVADDRLTGLDRWILAEFSTLEQAVAKAYDDFEFHSVYQKVSQFIAVELSAIYHDVVKDRLYTDAPNSARRRSTQTTLHRMVGGLCQMLAPIVTFTTDEAWEFIPGEHEESVYESVWQPGSFTLPEVEKLRWKTLFELRETALPQLEKARQAGQIGKALEARLTISGTDPRLAAATGEVESLRELLNVSQLEINPGGTETLTVSVTKADGIKCERCWHWETDVGANPEHPTICGRCVKAIGEIAVSQAAS
jgi:isoleucyl-tRNA synthetase